MSSPLLLTLLTLSLCSTAAVAEEFCATTSGELQASLDAAETNGQADTIRIATGSYEVPAGGGFAYNSAAPIGGDDEDISIIGGWTAFGNFPCGQLLSTNPFNTTLDGDNRYQVLSVQTRFFSNITVKNLALIRGFAPGDDGGGLFASGVGDYVGNVLIENNAILGNEAQRSGGMQLRGGETIRVLNNLIVANSALFGEAAMSLQSQNTNGIYLINNTILNNSVDLDSNLVVGGVLVLNNDSSEAFIANNILWGNSGQDLRLAGTGETHLFNNDIEARSGDATFEGGNLSVDPQFNSGLLDFNLSNASPLIDAGRNPPVFAPSPPPFEFRWSVPDLDLSDNPRIQGIRVDIGALEAAPRLLFIDGFE
ncbi:MAG: choice-of-anchor Q domain-containing protein [Lysobacterales bacterium]